MPNQQHKQEAYTVLEDINNRIGNDEKKIFSIKVHGINPIWKTIWQNETNITQGYDSWKKVVIFLRGVRQAQISLYDN